MALPAVLLKALPWLLSAGKGALGVGKKAVPLAKRAYASPHFLTGALGGTYLGSEILSQLGQAGERDIAREELALQRILGKAGGEATERLTKESRKAAESYLKELTKARREEAKQQREAALMESYMASQDRQLAIALQALQGVSQSIPETGMAPASPRSGMVGLMRSSF
jgi:succinate dehydrogenase/fumarate reductase flavoprotein subunit